MKLRCNQRIRNIKKHIKRALRKQVPCEHLSVWRFCLQPHLANGVGWPKKQAKIAALSNCSPKLPRINSIKRRDARVGCSVRNAAPDCSAKSDEAQASRFMCCHRVCLKLPLRSRGAAGLDIFGISASSPSCSDSVSDPSAGRLSMMGVPG